ncbi:MAG: protein kinase [Anaerolineae bacterium]|nr:protein kinase [Anaerolineae bacterium]
MLGHTLRNRYQVQTLLGEGSTATVYKALDTRLGRAVALKVLLPHVKDSVRARFFQEATAVAQLNHPGIMSIYDIDQESDIHFLVVEYVDGDTLEDHVPSPPDTVIEIGRQIALALDYAHEHHIIHRDIKPANIKVAPNGQVKIMDLGLALPRDAKRVTSAGMIIGTPAYLSPEQAQGLSLDYRTDIYSLGIVLYELATGDLPFTSDDIPALLLQHVRESPAPLRMLDPNIPVALENIVLKALEKNPVRRFQSAGALAQALAAIQRPERVSDTATQSSQSAPIPHERVPMRVALADDHAMLRKTLINFLSQRDEFVIVGEEGEGNGAVRLAVELQPDILLLDLNMPGKSGLEALPEIREKAPNVRVLVLTGRDEEWYITQALRAGANGYVLKSASESDLIDAILKVSQGTLVLGQGVAEKVVTGLFKPQADPNRLTDEERQVLLMIAGGMDNEQIAERLNLPVPMLIETLAGAMDKMRAKDRHAAALQALRQGYILLDELQSLN